MKTELAQVATENERPTGKTVDEQKAVKGSRRKLQPLQVAAGDKENLVGAGRITSEMAPSKENVSLAVEKKKSKLAEKIITVEDLTSEAGPSKAYWEALAEKRRLALEEALKENEQLHERIRVLEDENDQCKILLNETKALVETLTEVLNSTDENEYNSSIDVESGE